MISGLITGLVVGAALAYFICHYLAGRKEKIAGEAAEVLTISARRATSEAAGLRREVQDLQKGEREGSDLILLFPDLIKMIFTGRDSDEVVSFLNRACQSLLKANESAVFLADRTGARLSLSASTGLSEVFSKRINLGLGDGFVGLAAETGRLLFRDEMDNESVLVRRNMVTSDIPNFKPDYAAPMMAEGVLYGVITAGDFEGSGSMRRETLRALAAVGAAALINVRLLERFSRASNLDPETGFSGKATLEPVLENELERVERYGSDLAVIELHLKSVEALNPMVSREIINVVAKHLISSLRNIDTGIRADTDSMVLLLPGTDDQGMKFVTGKLGGELPLLKAEDGTHVGSVGIKSFVVEGGTRLDARTLLQKLRAEESMEFEGYYEI